MYRGTARQYGGEYGLLSKKLTRPNKLLSVDVPPAYEESLSISAEEKSKDIRML